MRKITLSTFAVIFCCIFASIAFFLLTQSVDFGEYLVVLGLAMPTAIITSLIFDRLFTASLKRNFLISIACVSFALIGFAIFVSFLGLTHSQQSTSDFMSSLSYNLKTSTTLGFFLIGLPLSITLAFWGKWWSRWAEKRFALTTITK